MIQRHKASRFKGICGFPREPERCFPSRWWANAWARGWSEKWTAASTYNNCQTQVDELILAHILFYRWWTQPRFELIELLEIAAKQYFSRRISFRISCKYTIFCKETNSCDVGNRSSANYNLLQCGMWTEPVHQHIERQSCKPFSSEISNINLKHE